MSIDVPPDAASLARLRAWRAKWPEIGDFLRKDRRIDREWDVPGGAGISRDGNTIYLDRHFPRVVNDTPADKYIALVRVPLEWILLRILGRRAGITDMQSMAMAKWWPTAQKLARAGEFIALTMDGYEWNAYQKGLDLIPKHENFGEISRPPPDLALYSYSGPLRAHLARRAREQRLPKGVVDYRVGSDAHRCGLCVMFLPRVERCTLVAGVIEAPMTCDKFERKPT